MYIIYILYFCPKLAFRPKLGNSCIRVKTKDGNARCLRCFRGTVWTDLNDLYLEGEIRFLFFTIGRINKGLIVTDNPFPRMPNSELLNRWCWICLYQNGVEILTTSWTIKLTNENLWINVRTALRFKRLLIDRVWAVYGKVFVQGFHTDWARKTGPYRGINEIFVKVVWEITRKDWGN